MWPSPSIWLPIPIQVNMRSSLPVARLVPSGVPVPSLSCRIVIEYLRGG